MTPHIATSHAIPMSPPRPVHRVAACVCTCRRPQMLGRCLASLAAQRIGPDIDLTIIVVDNEAVPANRLAVTAFAATCPYPVRYVHQPKRGIAAARNAALDAAMAAGVDWIAFLDDDETAASGWIARLMAPEYLSCPILLGLVIHETPDPMPFWARPQRPNQDAEGVRCLTGTTGNVRINAALVRDGFRFDETLGAMGGEDNELFTRARLAGHEIRRTRRAVVTEAPHPERFTYWGQVYRVYWTTASDTRRAAIAKGWARVIRHRVHKIPIGIVSGMAQLMVCPLFILGGLGRFKRRALGAGKTLARSAGLLAAMTGRLPTPYARIVGS